MTAHTVCEDMNDIGKYLLSSYIAKAIITHLTTDCKKTLNETFNRRIVDIVYAYKPCLKSQDIVRFTVDNT